MITCGVGGEQALGFEPIEGHVNGAACDGALRAAFDLGAHSGRERGLAEMQHREEHEYFEFSQRRCHDADIVSMRAPYVNIVGTGSRTESADRTGWGTAQPSAAPVGNGSASCGMR